MSSILVGILIRPRFDAATEISHEWAKQIWDWCVQANIQMLDLAEGDAVRSKVEQAIQERDPEIVVFYDHGDEKRLIGQDQEAVIDLGNCSLVAGRKIYTMACLSAKELGKSCHGLGSTYWGYVDLVSFSSDALDEFQESLNCGFWYLFVEGNSPEDALKLAKDKFTELAATLANQGKVLAAALMTGNREALRYWDGEEPEEEPEKPEGCLVRLLKLPVLLVRRSCRREGVA